MVGFSVLFGKQGRPVNSTLFSFGLVCSFYERITSYR